MKAHVQRRFIADIPEDSIGFEMRERYERVGCAIVSKVFLVQMSGFYVIYGKMFFDKLLE
jgi:hypothetical protein